MDKRLKIILPYLRVNLWKNRILETMDEEEEEEAKEEQDLTNREKNSLISYSEQLEKYISTYRRRPADIKHWPYGPYWPPDFIGCLIDTPHHIKACVPYLEYLYACDGVNLTTSEKQASPYPGRWRGMLVVYDSERSQRDHAPQPVPQGCCPNLVFESRFECGNLRQARRVGMYEYELVLRTDLYTNRHTQWYYFRVTNAVPGVTYKFRVVNLLKRDSLYNYGMRPLVYSEKDAREREIGWRRTGHHISYCSNIVNHSSPLLQRGVSYHMLEWQMEFPNSDDTYYLAHCYPYTFTDLKDDLDTLLSDPERQKVIGREVLCETRAGNSCFLLTVTDPETTEQKKKKKYVVITARVHPGETQASWIMRGLLFFITSDQPAAQELRKTCIFKIVPMINPDGVIVGNYRCSLAARDLNRNYRHPKRDNFPTIFAIKNMVDELLHRNEVVLYCDLHGHSRKQNVFMYGNNKINNQDGSTGVDSTQSFISDRLFPWLMSVKSPEKFSFNSCKFQIKRCKESTGRVVMWKQMKIPNSFTLEATFSGTILDKNSCRHFNCSDYEDMGRTLCEVVLDYQRLQDDKEFEMEVVMDLTRAIAHQILSNRGLLPKHIQLTELHNERVSDSGISLESSDMSSGSQTDTEKTPDNTPYMEAEPTNHKAAKTAKESQEDQSGKEKNTKEVRDRGRRKSTNQTSAPPSEKITRKDNSAVVPDTAKPVDFSAVQTLDGCLNLLTQLNVCQAVLESDSSDSDSETEPELKPVEQKQRKKKRKSRKQRDRENKKMNGDRKGTEPARKETPVTGSERLQKVKENAQFVSKYQGRSNGGVPCFTEERSLERAAKRMAEVQRRSEEDKEHNLTFYYCEDEFCQYPSTVSNFQLQRSATEEEFKKRIQVALNEGTSNLAQTLVGSNLRTSYMHADHIVTPVRSIANIQQSASFSLPITLPVVSSANSNNHTYLYQDISSDETDYDLDYRSVPIAVQKSPYQYESTSCPAQTLTTKRHIRTGPIFKTIPQQSTNQDPPLITSSIPLGRSTNQEHPYKNNGEKYKITAMSNQSLIGTVKRSAFRRFLSGD